MDEHSVCHVPTGPIRFLHYQRSQLLSPCFSHHLTTLGAPPLFTFRALIGPIILRQAENKQMGGFKDLALWHFKNEKQCLPRLIATWFDLKKKINECVCQPVLGSVCMCVCVCANSPVRGCVSCGALDRHQMQTVFVFCLI